MGRSRTPSSSGENGIRGTTSARNGISNKMMTGNPTAAGQEKQSHESVARGLASGARLMTTRATYQWSA